MEWSFKLEYDLYKQVETSYSSFKLRSKVSWFPINGKSCPKEMKQVLCRRGWTNYWSDKNHIFEGLGYIKKSTFHNLLSDTDLVLVSSSSSGVWLWQTCVSNYISSSKFMVANDTVICDFVTGMWLTKVDFVLFLRVGSWTGLALARVLSLHFFLALSSKLFHRHT